MPAPQLGVDALDRSESDADVENQTQCRLYGGFGTASSSSGPSSSAQRFELSLMVWIRFGALRSQAGPDQQGVRPVFVC